MKGFFKKSTSLVLALMMVLSMFTGMVFAANAETTVVFDKIEEDFDGETVNAVFENAGTVQDGKLVMAYTDNINFGYLTNFVFEADVTFKGIVGKKATTTSGNTFKFIFGKHDVRYYSNMSVYNAGGIEYHRITWTDDTKTTIKSINNTKSYDGWVVVETADVHGDGVLLPVKIQNPANESETKLLQHNTMVMDELIPGLHFQTHCTACSSYPAETVIGADRKINPTNADDVVRFRVEVFGNQLKIQAFYNDTMYGIERTIDAKNGGNYAGGTFKIGGMTEGVVAILDNVKFANLDTVRANGEVAGAALSGTTLLPGTPDDATGIVYGAEVDVDVFGVEYPMFIGGDVTIAADGYDYNKAGLRKGATLMVGDAVIGNYDITYLSGGFMSTEVDFSSATLPTGWTTTGSVENGVLTLVGEQNLMFDKSVGDFEFSCDFKVTADDTSVNKLPAFYFYHNGKFGTAVELAMWANKGVNKWRLMPRVNTNNQMTKSAVPGLVDVTYHIDVKTKDGYMVVNIVNAANANEKYTWNYDIPNTDPAQSTYGYVGFKGQAGATVQLDNVSLLNADNTADQTPYALDVDENASIVFDAETATISANGTATAKFYGFKPEGTVNLADVANEMYYVGDDTVRWGSFTLPCTVASKEAGSTAVDFEGDLPSGWTTTDKFVNDNGKYHLTFASSKSLKYALNYKNYVMEYDITPYLVQYITGSVISLVLPGPDKVTYEVGVFYDNYNSNTMKIEAYDAATFPEVGDTTSKLGGYSWRVYDRGAKAQQLCATGDIAPVGNSTVTSLSPETNEAFAEKFAFEDSVSYRVRVEMINNTLKVKIAVLGDEAIDWESVPYQEKLTRTDRVPATGTISFNTNMDDIEALIDNITINEVVEDVTIAGYEVATQALKVGAAASEINTAFKAVLSNGVKYDLPAEFIDSVSGYDNTKLGYQTVTLNYGEIAIEKQILLVDYDVFGFEDFEGYSAADTLPSTGNAPVAGAKVNWNTNAGAVANGAMTSTQAYHLVGGHSPKDKGVIAADITFPATAEYKIATAAKALGKYNSGGCVNFGIGFKTADPTKAVVFIGIGSNVLATAEMPFALGTTYRLEMRIYGNVVQGYVDDEVVLTHVVTDATALKTITTADRWGFDNSEAAAIVSRYFGGSSYASIGEALIDNVILGKDYTTYTVDGSAAETLNTLPTQAQPGDEIVVLADLAKNEALLVDGKPVYEREANRYTFTMPAKNVTVAVGEGEEIAPIATSIREDQSAVRFLNRLYLDAVEEEGAVVALDLGDITEFGALIYPADLLEGDLTIETAGAAKAVAYNETTSLLYNVTAKYVDYSVVVKTKNADREFVCVPYYVVNGEYVYGAAVTQSINGWLAQ